MNTNNFSMYSNEQGCSNPENSDYDVQIEYYGNHNSNPNQLLTEMASTLASNQAKRRKRRKANQILPENAVKCEILESNSQDYYNECGRTERDPLQTDEMHTNIPQRRRRRSSVRPETDEERANRLAKMSAYAAQRLANETAEQRAIRLRRMSAYAAQRLANETPEQRAIRLQRMSAYAARRIAAETPEQRAARLARMAAYASKRHATKKAATKSPSQVAESSNLEESS